MLDDSYVFREARRPPPIAPLRARLTNSRPQLLFPAAPFVLGRIRVRAASPPCKQRLLASFKMAKGGSVDIFLAGMDSLRMQRVARRDQQLLLVPTEEGTLRRDHGGITAAALAETLPQQYFSPTRTKPVTLSFLGDSARSQCGIIRATPNLARLSDNAFLEVVKTDGSPLAEVGGTTAHVFVESAGLTLISAAREIQRSVRHERLTRNAALVRLSGFLMELCGSYARDPLHPSEGEVLYDLPPLTTVAEVREFLQEARSLHGLELARLAAGYANDGSGSSMETLWYHAFCLPPRLGGLRLARPLQNAPLAWPPEVRDLVKHKTMRPDFFWGQYRVACERQGKDHASESALSEDCDRARDYELCDIAYLPVSKKDAKSEESVRAFLAQLVEKVAPHECPAFRRRMQHHLEDPGVIAARRVMLSQLRPAWRTHEADA